MWLYGVSGVERIADIGHTENIYWAKCRDCQQVGLEILLAWYPSPPNTLTSVEDVSTYIIWAPKQQQMCHLCCHTTCPATTYKERRQFVTRLGRGNDWTFLSPKCEATSPDCPSIGCPRANLMYFMMLSLIFLMWVPLFSHWIVKPTRSPVKNLLEVELVMRNRGR